MITVIYSPESETITQINKLEENLTIYTKINIKDETISHNGEEYKKLDESDIYTFKSIIENIEINDDLMKKLLNMKYFKEVYLPYSLSSFVTPYNEIVGYFFMFSTLFVPYQMVDIEKSNNPKYAHLLQEAFNETNSATLHHFKKLIRTALVIPGLIFTPIILVTVLFALNKMS